VSGSFLDKNTGKCVSPLTYCQNQNGPLATYNSVDNSCGCATGYGLGSNNMCESHYQTCGEKYPNTTWDGTYSSDGKYNCVCQTGYTWNSYSQSCY
jgi:hypothetical protein